jgi:acylphosphatase
MRHLLAGAEAVVDRAPAVPLGPEVGADAAAEDVVEIATRIPRIRLSTGTSADRSNASATQHSPKQLPQSATNSRRSTRRPYYGGPMIRRHVIVRGAVQGVFFRASCQQEAARQGVAGWVANRPDGSVEVVFEGSDDAVAHLVEWCRTGPPRASVTDVEVTAEEPVGETGFTVR